MTSIRSSQIIAKGSENQRSAPKALAASRALCSLRVATADSFRPGIPLIAGTCDTFAQPDLAFAPTIPTRICFWVASAKFCLFIAINLAVEKPNPHEWFRSGQSCSRSKTNPKHLSDESSAARNCPVPSSPRTPTAPVRKTRRTPPSPPPAVSATSEALDGRQGQDTCQNQQTISC